MAALSCDDAESHKGWINDIKFYTEGKFSYPIIADPDRVLAKKLGMIDPDEVDSKGMPLTARAVSIVQIILQALQGFLTSFQSLLTLSVPM